MSTAWSTTSRRRPLKGWRKSTPNSWRSVFFFLVLFWLPGVPGVVDWGGFCCFFWWFVVFACCFFGLVVLLQRPFWDDWFYFPRVIKQRWSVASRKGPHFSLKDVLRRWLDSSSILEAPIGRKMILQGLELVFSNHSISQEKRVFHRRFFQQRWFFF